MVKAFVPEDTVFSLETFDPLGAPLHVILWGPPGGGKSIMALGFPRPRWLNLDADEGSSIAWAMRKGLIPRDTKFKQAVITERQQSDEHGKYGFVQIPRAMDRVTDKIDQWLEERDEWDTLVLDSATALNLMMLFKGTKGYGEIKRSESWAQSVKIQALSPRIQDYMPAKSYFLQLVQWLRTLNKNIVLICHEYSEENDSGFVLGRYPFLIGSLRQEVPKEFGEVWYMSVNSEENDRYSEILTAPDKKLKISSAKTRMGFLPNRIRNPTYAKIITARRLNAEGASEEEILKVLEADPATITL